MKYKIIKNSNHSETKIIRNGKVLYRIEALKDFGSVKAGDWGGFVELEYNLSQEGNCWIFWHAKVWGNVQITGDSIICGRSNIFT